MTHLLSAATSGADAHSINYFMIGIEISSWYFIHELARDYKIVADQYW